MHVYLQIAAPNDRNGNPRRCFAVWEAGGQLVAVLDEGYVGDREVRAAFPRAAFLGRISVMPAEYRAWVQTGRELVKAAG